MRDIPDAAQINPIWRGASSHVHKATGEQNGGYSRRRAKTEVALRDGFWSASVLGWQSSCLRPRGMARVLPYL
jgi:hypothetical protein